MVLDQESISLLGADQSAKPLSYDQPRDSSPTKHANGGLTQDADRREGQTNGSGDADSEGAPGKGFALLRLPNRKKAILLLLSFANIAANTCFALLGPFFPAEAQLKGMSPAVTGIVFSCFEFWIFLSSPVYGNFMSVLGPRFVFIAGQFLAGGCSFLFGLLYLTPPGAPFTVLSIMLRTVKALGASGFITASFTLIAIEFPDNVSMVFGVLEVFSGLGYVVGPIIGGTLYEIGGFGLPFYLMGSILLVCCCLTFLLLPVRPAVAERPKSKRSIVCLLKSPLTLLSAMTVVFGSYTLGFFDASLAFHVEQFHLSALITGLLMSIVAVIYSLTAPIFGWITDKFGHLAFRLLIMGNLIIFLSMMLIGPSPLLPFLTTEIWLIVISLIVLGPGFAATIVPAFKCFYIEASRMGFEDSTELDGLVSGLLTSSIHLGGFFGPTIGNAVLETSGYEWASTLNAGVCFFSAGMLASYLLAQKVCLKGTDDVETSGGRDTETTYLVQASKSEDSPLPVNTKYAEERDI